MTEHIWKQDYIIVRKMRTEDGSNPEVDSEDRVKYRETEHPLIALADFEKENEKLPRSQKMKITIVRIHEPITLPAKKQAAPVQQTEQDEIVVEQPSPAKRGPKPKANDLA